MEFQTQNKMINILQLLDILSICFKVSQGQKMVASIQGIEHTNLSGYKNPMTKPWIHFLLKIIIYFTPRRMFKNDAWLLYSKIWIQDAISFP